jgi:hypothetical protein
MIIISYEDLDRNTTDLGRPDGPIALLSVRVDSSGDDVNVHIRYKRITLALTKGQVRDALYEALVLHAQRMQNPTRFRRT